MFSRRALEALTAAITGAFGIAIALQSLDNGIGWSSGGGDSRTFSFMTGALVTARRQSLQSRARRAARPRDRDRAESVPPHGGVIPAGGGLRRPDPAAGHVC